MSYTKTDCFVLFLTFFVLVTVFTFYCSPKINPENYRSFMLILILLIFGLSCSNKYKAIGLFLLIFLLFTIYFYMVMVCYSYKSYHGASFESWNENMKEMCSELWEPEVINRQKYKGPVIYALYSNHFVTSGLIDFLSFGFIDAKAKVVMKDFGSDHFLNKIVDTGIFLKFDKNNRSKENYDNFMKKCSEEFKKENSIVIFPEGDFAGKKRYDMENWKYLTNLKSGTFKLSKQTGVPIVPVIQEHYRNTGWLFSPGKFRIHMLDPLYPDDFRDWDSMRTKYRQVMEEKLKEI